MALPSLPRRCPPLPQRCHALLQRRDRGILLYSQLFAVILVVALIVKPNRDKPSAPTEDTGVQTKEIETAPPITVDSLAEKYESCTITHNIPEIHENGQGPTKIIWAPAYPDTIDTNIMKDVAHGLTGLSNGARSYYMRTSDARGCQSSRTVTAFCLVMDETLQSPGTAFSPEALYLIRNVKTLAPAHHNAKGHRYHGVVGQVTLDGWRGFRDEWFFHIMDLWSKQMLMWHNATSIGVGMYLSYEDLMDPVRGPETLKELAVMLLNAGYPTPFGALSPDSHLVAKSAPNNSALDADFGCLWYQILGHDRIAQYLEYGYEYSDFLPGYTTAQRDGMLEGLDNLIKQIQEQKPPAETGNELLDIVKSYRDDVRDNTPLDD